MEPDNTQQIISSPVSPTNQSSQFQSSQVKPGGAWSRFWASVIDDLILTIPTFLFAFILSAVLGSPIPIKGNVVDSVTDNTLAGVIFLIFYTLYTVYLTVNKGATWGKDAYGLRVVKYGTTELITYNKAFLREFIKTGILLIPILGVLIYFINGLIIIFSREKRGIHDRVAGTQVVKLTGAWSIHKQLLIFSSIVVLTILVFGIGWFLDKHFSPVKQQSESKLSVSYQPSESIVDWQTYTNTRYGYSVKYPPKFTSQSVFSDRDQDLSTSPYISIQSEYGFKSLKISVDIKKDENQSLSDFINEEIKELKESNKQVKDYIPLKIINESVIDGRKAIFVSNNDNSKGLDLRVYVEKDKTNIIYIQLGSVYQGSEEEYKAFFYQVLSTFKFI